MQRIISIVIPAYNRLALLRETVASIRTQSDERWECIIADNGSTDGTRDFAEALSHEEPRFRYVSTPEDVRGANPARNLGTTTATGSHLIFLDSDDLLSPDRIALSHQYLDETPDADAVIFQCEHFHATPGDVGTLHHRFDNATDDLAAFLQQRTIWMTASPTWQKAFIEKIGSWDETFPRMQDWALHVKALICKMNYRKVPEVGYYWRVAEAEDRMTHKDIAPELALRLFHYQSEQWRLLVEHGMASDAHAAIIEAGAYYWLRRYLLKEKSGTAISLWKGIRREGFVNPGRWRRAVFELYRIALCKKFYFAARALMEKRFDRSIFGKHLPFN